MLKQIWPVIFIVPDLGAGDSSKSGVPGDRSCVVVSLDRECFGENCREREKALAEALSIRRLEGSRWQGGRVWSYKLVWRQSKLTDECGVGRKGC
jgi:hypothetical protein